MSERDDNPPVGKPVAGDPWLNRGRELVAAILALIVVVGSAILVANAFRLVGVDDTNDQSFQHAKDLITIVLPLLGVVLGYYFTKVSTEGRAETAERSARVASASAQQATEARMKAEHRTQETKQAMREVSTAAEKVLRPDNSRLETLGAQGSDETARVELKAALARANRHLD